MKKYLSILLVIIMALFTATSGVTANAAVTLPSSKIKKVVQVTPQTLKIKWKKVSSAKKYELYCKSGGGKYKKIATLNKNTTSYKHKNVQIGKKYFYKVRSYKVVNGKKYYSKFSNIVGGRTTNYLMSLTKPYSTLYYEEITNGKVMSMGGDNYTNGFDLALNGKAVFNLKGKYSKISFTVGSRDALGYGDISILVDDQCIWTYTVGKTDLPKTFTVDIDYANKLEFKTDCGSGYSIGIANIKVY